MDRKILKNKANAKGKIESKAKIESSGKLFRLEFRRVTGKAKQLSFADYSSEFKEYWRDIKKTKRSVHGGAYAKGKRKTARPFSAKKPIHLVLRSSRAKGAYSMLNPRNRGNINSTVYDHAVRCGVILYNYSNNGNHLHMLLRSKEHESLQKFLRSVAGIIARKVTGACKGNAQGKFWDSLAFSRVSEWGKAFDNLKNYVIQNILEAAGVVTYRERGGRAPPYIFSVG